MHSLDDHFYFPTVFIPASNGDRESWSVSILLPRYDLGVMWYQNITMNPTWLQSSLGVLTSPQSLELSR